MMMVLNVPATLGLVTLAEPIVRLLFERGHFTSADTVSTAAALRFYAIGLVGYATARIVSPVFYAMGRSRVPVAVSLCTVAINLVANIALVRVLGFRGLALGTSLAMLVNGLVLLLLLRRRTARPRGRLPGPHVRQDRGGGARHGGGVGRRRTAGGRRDAGSRQPGPGGAALFGHYRRARGAGRCREVVAHP